MADDNKNRIDNENLYVKDLDFLKIRENLVEYLRNQDELKDYDFEGSGLIQLLDVLAYNTHYNAINTNIALNELYIDSAQHRGNVVSRAAELGYNPRGARCSRGIIHVKFSNPNQEFLDNDQVVIPRGTRFRGTIDGRSYNLTTIDEYTFTPIAGVYEGDIEVYGGKIRHTSFISDQSTNPDSKFTLPSDLIDYNLMRVYSKDTADSSFRTPYNRVEDLIGVDRSSLIYFVYDSITEQPYIQFGDGVFGRKLRDREYVEVEYLISDLGASNGVRNISLVDNVAGNGDVEISVVERIDGGLDKENVNEIKRNSQLSKFTQNRAVIEDDYEAIVKSSYGNMDSISVWGGERNTPPQYGVVFMSIKPSSGQFLSETEKNRVISEFVRPNAMVTTIPQIVDPQYVYLDLNISFDYNRDSSSLTLNEIRTGLQDIIEDFNTANLTRHRRNFIYSQMIKLVYEMDPGVTGILTDINMRVNIVPNINSDQYYQIDFSNPVNPSSGVSSNEFTFRGEPGCVLVSNQSSGEVFVRTPSGDQYSVGDIDYNTGILQMELNVNSSESSMLKISAVPRRDNVYADRNVILDIDKIDIDINQYNTVFNV